MDNPCLAFAFAGTRTEHPVCLVVIVQAPRQRVQQLQDGGFTLKLDIVTCKDQCPAVVTVLAP